MINELGVVKKDQGSAGEETTISLPSLDPYINLFKNHISKCVIKQDKLNQSNAAQIPDESNN